MTPTGLACSIHPAGPGDRTLAASVREALAGQGIEVDEQAPAICVANQPVDAVPDVVRLAAGGGRVLVVGEKVPRGGAAWQVLSSGASDILPWEPESLDTIVARLTRWREIDEVVDADFVRRQLVGRSVPWLTALRRVVEIARFSSAGMLVAGESGTGKELVARLLHHLDTRPDKGKLIVLDCTTIVPTLSGSEFFGHERGAFTGASTAREGAFAAADRGTLFLDEVGELPLPMQAELLRVVQEGSYKRVGGDAWRTTRFRLICATNRDLGAELTAGRFRLDLYHRIAANVVRLPPLRERRGDVLPLFEHFLAEAAGASLRVDPAVSELLHEREYPGNVRDLRQLAVRIATRHVGPGCVTPGDVPDEERPLHATTGPCGLLERAIDAALVAGQSYREIRELAGDIAVRLAVEHAGGSLQEAARRLGVTDRMLQLRRARE